MIQYKATSGFIFQIFVKSQVLGLQVSISDLSTYPLTLTPYSMATIDGFFAKTNKAQGMNYLIKDADNACALLPDPNECAIIQDGNSSFYMKNVPRQLKRYHNESSVVCLLQLKQFSVQTVMSIGSTHQSRLNGIGESVVKSSSLRD